MPTVLVTGGAGYIGSHICKALKRRGYVPVTLDNLTHGHVELVRFGPLEMGDISNVDWVRGIIQRHAPEAAIHCAAFTSVTESLTNPSLYYSNNVIGTLSLLNAMVAEGVQRLIFSSSCAVHGIPEFIPIREEDPCKPVTPYGRSKHMMEQVISDYADAYGLRATCLRYFNAAGADPEGEAGELHDPETHAIPLALRSVLTGIPFRLYGTDYPTPDGTAIRDYVHVSDLAEAHVLALKFLEDGGWHPAFNIGTGQGTSVRELLTAIHQVTGRAVPIQETTRRPGDPAELVADVTKARNTLGFSPVYSAIEAIVETAWKWHSGGSKAVLKAG